MIGDIVKVTVDRAMRTYHPEHLDMYYPVNYGYIEGIMALMEKGKMHIYLELKNH